MHCRKLCLFVIIGSSMCAVSSGQFRAQAPEADPLPAGVLVRLGSTRWRHGGAGNALAFTRDGKTLISAGTGDALRRWDVATGKELERWPLRDSLVQALAFSPDGKTLAAVGADGRVCVHDSATGKEIKDVRWSSTPLYAVAFSADGSLVASAGRETSIGIVDLGPKPQNRLIPGHDGSIGAVAFAPKGLALASASSDGTVRFWDALNRREVCRIQTDDSEFATVAFSVDGKTLAVGGTRSDKDSFSGYSERLQIWDTSIVYERLQLKKPDNKQLKQLLVELDSPKLDVRQKAAVGLETLAELAEPALKQALADGPPLEMRQRIEQLLQQLKKGPPRPGVLRHDVKVEDLSIRALAFSPDGQVVATAAGERIVFWSVRTGKELHRLATRGSAVALAFHPDGKSLAFTDSSGVIGMANAAAGDGEQRWGPQVRQTPVPGPTGTVTDVAFAADGAHIASCGNGEKVVRIWDSATAKELRTLDTSDFACTAVAFSTDGKTLAAGGDRGGLAIRVWRADGYQGLNTIRSDLEGWMFGIRFSADGKSVAAARWTEEADGFIHHWNVVSGEIGKPVIWKKIRSAPALFADGRTLAVGSIDKLVRLADAFSGAEGRTLTGHAGEVWKVVALADGKLLASCSDRTRKPATEIRIWDPATGTERYQLDVPIGQAAALAFSADGKLLAAAGSEGKIRLWSMSTGRPLPTLEGPTAVECLAFAPDGRRLAAGGTDTTVLVWKIDNN